MYGEENVTSSMGLLCGPVLDVVSPLYTYFAGPVLALSTGPTKQVWREGYHVNDAVFPPFLPTCKAGLYLMGYPPLHACFVGPILDPSTGPAKHVWRIGFNFKYEPALLART